MIQRQNQRFTLTRQHQGFTLVELILVIILLGIVGVGTANFIRSASNIYVDVSQRESLLRGASFAVERFTRELSTAVPNSVRIGGNAAVHCVEFVPINWSSFYLDLPLASNSTSNIETIEMSSIDGVAYVPNANELAIVYPLTPSHVYDPSTQRAQPILSCSDDGDGDCATLDDGDKVIQLEVANDYPLSSPTSRVYLANTSISYCVRNQSLYRHVGGVAVNQPIYTSGGSLMAQGLNNVLSASPATNPQITDPFQSIAATLQRNGYTRANFLFSRDDEQISIVKEVQVPNVP